LNRLYKIFNWKFYSESGSIDPIFKEFSEGRIREEKRTIDL